MADGGRTRNNETDRGWEEDSRDRRGDRRDRGSGRRRERRNRDRSDRGRRERIPKIHERSEQHANTQPTPVPIKTPIILTKASAEKVLQQHENQSKEEPIKISIQKREDGIGFPGSLPSNLINIASGAPKGSTSDSTEQGKPQDKGKPQEDKGDNVPVIIGSAPANLTMSGSGIDHLTTGLSALKVNSSFYPDHSFSVVDENFHWSDKALEVLMDHTDFVVVGVAGLQGSGKSTVMSSVARPRGFLDGFSVFKAQTGADVEKCTHRTLGIDCYITSQRLILLDCQPLLSPSMLDRYLRHEKKIPSDYSTSETCIEMQSLQILTFLFTVCHVVLVVQDYFADVHLLKLLKTAEMLKPPTHATQEGSGGGAGGDDLNEHFPHIVFCYNRCQPEDFNAECLKKMCVVTEKMFQHSNLRISESASILRSDILPVASTDQLSQHRHLNIFLLPEIEEDEFKPDQNRLNVYSKYKGHPSYQLLSLLLHQQLVAMPRQQLTHHPLTEKNWFHYAARTWESVKKSPFLAEYHRLLSS